MWVSVVRAVCGSTVGCKVSLFIFHSCCLCYQLIAGHSSSFKTCDVISACILAGCCMKKNHLTTFNLNCRGWDTVQLWWNAAAYKPVDSYMCNGNLLNCSLSTIHKKMKHLENLLKLCIVFSKCSCYCAYSYILTCDCIYSTTCIELINVE